MNNLTEEQVCYVWDEMTELAYYCHKQIKKVMRQTGADYDYVIGVLQTMHDCDFERREELEKLNG